MKTVTDLGKEIKDKYPGTYDHLSDDEVGRRVKRKNPAKYAQYQETSLSVYSGGQSVQVEVKQLDHFINELNGLSLRYNAEHGRIVNWWERGKVESGNKFLAAVVEQLQLIIQAINYRTEAHSLAWRHQAGLEIEKLMHDNQGIVLAMATAIGMDQNSYIEKIRMQLEIDKEITLAREQAEIEYQKILYQADVDSKMLLIAEIYDAQKKYYRLLADKAPKREIDAAKAHLDELKQMRDAGWESIIKR